jgi:TatD DNase family protein
LAERHSGRVLAAVGLHPHDADKWGEQEEAISEMAPDVAAIGETGLDFYRSLSSPTDQEVSFRSQIELAIDHDKPLIVHCRDAFSKVHEILEDMSVGERTVLHCWTGGRKWTRRFLELGVTFSFAGPVAFETGETIRLAVELIPPERSLVETDTPYLAPPPHRGQQNEPAWVAFVGAALAKVWGMSVDEVAAFTTANAERIFKR